MILRVKIKDGEYFWCGEVNSATDMPITKGMKYDKDFREHARNQMMPLILSSMGRYIWSEKSFRIFIDNDELCVEGENDLKVYEGGATLKDAYLSAMENHFPFKETREQNKTLPREFFKTAQFNTWVEYTYNPTQEKVLKYAHDAIDNGFDAGILIIDEGWHGRYGQWKFDKYKFPDPKAMINELHSLGFKVMLWITPFVTPDGMEFAMDTRADFNPESYNKLFLRDANGGVAMVRWWNGISAILDFRKECDRAYLKSKLDFLMNEYGVDGFKCDGGSYDCYAKSEFLTPIAPDHDQAELNLAWNEFGSQYTFHEYKDTFKGGGKATIQRLCDREHKWNNGGIASLVPCGLLQGLFGHPFICPDMIGGGSWTDELMPDFVLDEELFIRMAQASALFPMMQFSWAPWRVLSKENYDIVVDAYKLHNKFSNEIIDLVAHAEKTGEPILRALEYVDPHRGYAPITDEFMLGNDILVCPILTKGTFEKEITFPSGKWQGVDKNVYEGNQKAIVKAPLDKLLYFRRIK